MSTLKIRYSCTICKTDDRVVVVAARESEELDVVVWMRTVVVPTLTKDHKQRNPGCWAKEITQIKIPLPADDDEKQWIGAPQP